MTEQIDPPRSGKLHAIQQQSERSPRKAGDNDLQAEAAESEAVEE